MDHYSLEFGGIEIWIIETLPNTQEFHGIFITKPSVNKTKVSKPFRNICKRYKIRVLHESNLVSLDDNFLVVWCHKRKIEN